MAALIVLKFDDDKAAQKFVQEHSDETPFDTFEVYAAYKMPTMFHAAFETHGAKKTQGAWTMGQKWGWWICSVCAKPSALYWETIKKQSSFGRNILDLYRAKREDNPPATD